MVSSLSPFTPPPSPPRANEIEQNPFGNTGFFSESDLYSGDQLPSNETPSPKSVAVITASSNIEKEPDSSPSNSFLKKRVLEDAVYPPPKEQKATEVEEYTAPSPNPPLAQEFLSRAQSSTEDKNKQQLLIQAIEQDSYLFEAYEELSLTLSQGETVHLRGRDWNNQQLLIYVIKLNSLRAYPYGHLADTLDREETVIVEEGESWDRRTLLLKAIDLNPGWGAPYSDLADMLLVEESITLNDESIWAPVDLYIECISLQPKYAPAYVGLALTLADNEEVELEGDEEEEILSKQDLYIRAIHFDSELGDAYRLLANTLSPGDTIDLEDGTNWSKEALLQKAATLT